jgi:hypothetical protein
MPTGAMHWMLVGERRTRRQTKGRLEMLLAADYPFMNVFWSILIFFAWVCWIMLLFRVFADVFRRSDIGGWGKAGWIVMVVILPWLGVLIYLIANGRHMGDRDLQQARASQAQFDDYVKTVANSSGPADQINRAKELLDSGTIDQAEFQALKAKALA